MRKIYFLLLMFCISVLFTYAQSTTFNYTGTVQTYTVPAGISSIAADVSGAQGGNFSSPAASGGLGGRAQGTIAVTPGQILQIYVGQQAGSSSCGSGSVGGGNSGGGAQGGNANPFGCGGSGGGGSSDVRTVAGSSFAALDSRLLVGGGGGGAAWSCGGESGGTGGGLTGGNGINCGSYNLSSCGGPGTQTAGGAAGSGASAGGVGFGGNGGTNYSSGGGGGYYGGGGSQNGGACGGSSYIAGTGVTSATTTSGFRSGNGIVIITPLCSNPPASTGEGNLCAGASTTFSNTVASGTWSSSNTAVASIVAGTGVLTAASAGTANITYSVGGGCFSSRTVTVTVAPSISGIATNSPLCANSTLTLTANSPVNVTSFLWEGPAAIIGTSTSSASVPGIGTSGSGIYSLTVTNGTGVGCVITYTTSVSILASPASITGPASVCQSFSTTVINTVAGGTWTSTNTSVAPISSSGVVTGSSAGTAIISYTLSSGCTTTREVTVNSLPVITISPSSSATVCLSNSASFSAIAPGATFNWVGVSGATGLSCTSCAAPAITPAATGASVYSVTATSGAGCTTTSGVTVTVNELPSDISGSSNVCVGTATTLTSSAGGDWTSSNVGVAAIGISSGVVTGLSTGAVTISYTLPTGCRKTAVMNVLATPAPIGGTAAVCSGLTTNLTHPVSGGTWSSSDAVVASVNPSGVVTGGTAGNATISYTLPSGCIVTATCYCQYTSCRYRWHGGCVCAGYNHSNQCGCRWYLDKQFIKRYR
jgi:trimeric autotransporter adhesin